MQKTTLPNGLTIITEPNLNSKSTTLSFCVNVGSFNEEDYPHGTARFLEHMFFKGTKNRTYKQINEDIANTGGDINAQTSFEETKYLCTVPYNEWKTGLDVLCDMMWNSLFLEEEIEKERNVIIEEIKSYNDDAQSVAIEAIFENINIDYPERQSILGTIHSVSNITKEDLLDFVDEFYQPNNMILVGTGKVDHNELVNYLLNYNITRSGVTTIKKKYFLPKLTPDSFVITKDIEQAQLTWGLFGPPCADDDFYIMEVIANLLAGNMSSRLYNIIREEKGLAYHILVDNEGLKDASVMVGQVSLDISNLEEVENIIKSELERLKEELVDQEELNRTIKYTVGSMIISLEDNENLNHLIGSSYLCGLPTSVDEIINKYKSVTANDIKRVANWYFGENKMLFIEIVPDEDFDENYNEEEFVEVE